MFTTRFKVGIYKNPLIKNPLLLLRKNTIICIHSVKEILKSNQLREEIHINWAAKSKFHNYKHTCKFKKRVNHAPPNYRRSAMLV